MKKSFLTLSFVLNGFLLLYIFLDIPYQVVKYRNLHEKQPKPGTVNIVMLGNSITAGGKWDKLLNRKDVFNGGMPGWTTQQLSWVIKDFIIPYHPKLCFFKAGINDYTLGIGTDRIYKNDSAILDSIFRQGTMPVYQTTLYQSGNIQVNHEIDDLNSRMLNFCKKHGYEFVDLRPFLCKDGDIRREYTTDGTHLTDAAYVEWAKAIRPVLVKYKL